MKSKYIIISIIVSVIASIAIFTSLVSANQKDNGMQITFQKEIDLIQNNNLMTDERKISKIVELFLKLKKEDYKVNSAVDISPLLYDNEEFAKNHKFVKDKMRFNKELRIQQNQKILWDNIDVTIEKKEIKDDKATVEVYENYEFVLDDYNDGISSIGTSYTISLQKYDNKWLIAEIKSNDEFDKAYYETGFDVNKKLKELTTSIDIDVNTKNQYMEKEKKYLEEKNNRNSNGNLLTQWTYYDYNRDNAGLYAWTYAEDTRDYSTTWYNNKFAEYASGGLNSDCQNFGSQCVWYGFGGIDNQTYINNKSFPMVSTGSRAWYQTSTRYDTPSTWVWTNVGSFANYISNGGYQIEGPNGYISTGYLATVERGDIIQVTDGSSWYHTYVVDMVDGTFGSRTNSNIWVSAHTLNREHNRLDTLFGSSQTSLRAVRIFGYYRP